MLHDDEFTDLAVDLRFDIGQISPLLVRAQHDRARSLTSGDETAADDFAQLIADALDDLAPHELREVVRDLLNRIPEVPPRNQHPLDPNLMHEESETP